MQEHLPSIVAVAIVGAGVVTGLLFAFSNFVLGALAEMPARHGMFAMQRINERILNPVFFGFFFGTPLLCLAIAVMAAREVAADGSALLIAGALAYLAGPLAITMLRNVPLNDRLARTPEASAEIAWPSYRRDWQRWNHARTWIGILATLLLAAGLAAR